MIQTLEASRFDPPGLTHVMISFHDSSQIKIMNKLPTIPSVKEVKKTIGSCAKANFGEVIL